MYIFIYLYICTLYWMATGTAESLAKTMASPGFGMFTHQADNGRYL
jgi:hypothetical protein